MGYRENIIEFQILNSLFFVIVFYSFELYYLYIWSLVIILFIRKKYSFFECLLMIISSHLYDISLKILEIKLYKFH